MHREDLFEPVMLERESIVLFARKKDEEMRFCVSYRILKTIDVSKIYQLLGMGDGTDSLGMQPSSAQSITAVGTGRCRYPERTAEERPFPAILGCRDLSGCRSD